MIPKVYVLCTCTWRLKVEWRLMNESAPPVHVETKSTNSEREQYTCSCSTRLCSHLGPSPRITILSSPSVKECLRCDSPTKAPPTNRSPRLLYISPLLLPRVGLLDDELRWPVSPLTEKKSSIIAACTLQLHHQHTNAQHCRWWERTNLVVTTVHVEDNETACACRGKCEILKLYS